MWFQSCPPWYDMFWRNRDPGDKVGLMRGLGALLTLRDSGRRFFLEFVDCANALPHPYQKSYADNNPTDQRCYAH